MPARAAAALVALALVACVGAGRPRPRELPPSIAYTGLWDSNWGQLRLTQSGKRVTGSFSGFREGAITGTLDGDVLYFAWLQRPSEFSGAFRGRGFLQLSPDGNFLEGRWGYLDDDDEGGRWWGQRVQPDDQAPDAAAP